MGYEIDFLPVGDGSRSGDAILMRWGNLFGSRDQQTVIAVDGGFDDNAEQIVKHMSDYYHTDQLDLVVSTHPDTDHVNGLRGVLDLVKVNQLWMHRPWNHVPDSKKQSVKKSLGAAHELEQIALSKRIPIVEPFAGEGLDENDGLLWVAGPTEPYYATLLRDFGAVGSQNTKGRSRVNEDWWTETLNDEGETTAENNSSVILRMQHRETKILLTGDAGIPSLEHAYRMLIAAGLLQQFKFVQVPHHGSKRNVGPTILDQLLGKIVDEQTRRGVAFVSCAPDGLPKHPNKRVTNAFTRRGYPVTKTAGSKIGYHNNAPTRDGWGPATELPLYSFVEDD